MVPNLSDVEPTLEIPLGDERDGRRLIVVGKLIPSPEWFALCESVKDSDGNVDYVANAADFVAAGVARVGDQDTEPVPLEAGDDREIANYPAFVVTRILGFIVRANTVGWSGPLERKRTGNAGS